MSSLLVFDIDCVSTPSVVLHNDRNLAPNQSLGCGFAWYPNDDYASAVIKDPQAQHSSSFVKAVTNWSIFRSTTFFCYMSGASKNPSQHNTQPFNRSNLDCDWVFMHQGDLDKAKLEQLKPEQFSKKPIGTTDSEIAFCYLLEMALKDNVRKLSEFDNTKLLEYFRILGECGTANIALSDGNTTVIYRGTHSPMDIYFTRITPPYGAISFDSNEISLYFDDPRDQNRTIGIFTTIAFNDGLWEKLDNDHFVVSTRGSIVWSNRSIQGKETNMHANHDLMFAREDIKSKQPNLIESISEKTHHIVNPRAVTHDRHGNPLYYRLYEIEHTSRYTYEKPVDYSTHTLRLQPVEDSLQEIVSATIEMSSAGDILQFEDVFGNQTVHCIIEKPYIDLTITSKSQIKVYSRDTDDFSFDLRRGSIPLSWMPWQRQMMLPYLMPMELPESQILELTDYAMSFVKRNDAHLLATLLDINQQIYKDYSYVPGHTSLQTTPFDVFISRKGVCQDFANLFICLARLLSIPARYRMGYIYTGGAYENTLQSDASHAWVEVYLPYLGWRGFDPTNGCMVNQDHIRVACGRNYVDATPISGTLYKGGGAEKMSLDVKVKIIETEV